LRQAALIPGFAYLLSPITTAEFSIMPKLVIAGNIEQTVQNIVAHGGFSLPQYAATWSPLSRTWLLLGHSNSLLAAQQVLDSRCFAGLCQKALLANASTASPTGSRRLSAKPANSPRPESGQRLAGYADDSPETLRPMVPQCACLPSAPATDRSRGSCPIAGNAAERQPDRARMLPSELPNPACAGARQVQCRSGLKPVSERRRGSCREVVSDLQKVRLVSAESSAIREFLS